MKSTALYFILLVGLLLPCSHVQGATPCPAGGPAGTGDQYGSTATLATTDGYAVLNANFFTVGAGVTMLYCLNTWTAAQNVFTGYAAASSPPVAVKCVVDPGNAAAGIWNAAPRPTCKPLPCGVNSVPGDATNGGASRFVLSSLDATFGPKCAAFPGTPLESGTTCTIACASNFATTAFAATATRKCQNGKWYDETNVERTAANGMVPAGTCANPANFCVVEAFSKYTAAAGGGNPAINANQFAVTGTGCSGANGVASGTTCQVVCGEGFTLVSPPLSISCSGNTWTPAAVAATAWPTCVPNRCSFIDLASMANSANPNPTVISIFDATPVTALTAANLALGVPTGTALSVACAFTGAVATALPSPNVNNGDSITDGGLPAVTTTTAGAWWTGFMTGFTAVGTTADVTNYLLTVTCRNGKWDRPPPVCALRATSCSVWSINKSYMYAITGGAATCDQANGLAPTGATCNVACNNLLYNGGTVAMTCTNGNWGNTPPICTPRVCLISDLAFDFTAFKLSGSGCNFPRTSGVTYVASGVTCNVTCATTTTNPPSTLRTCTMGQWSGANPTCAYSNICSQTAGPATPWAPLFSNTNDGANAGVAATNAYNTLAPSGATASCEIPIPNGATCTRACGPGSSDLTAAANVAGVTTAWQCAATAAASVWTATVGGGLASFTCTANACSMQSIASGTSWRQYSLTDMAAAVTQCAALSGGPQFDSTLFVDHQTACYVGCRAPYVPASATTTLRVCMFGMWTGTNPTCNLPAGTYCLWADIPTAFPTGVTNIAAMGTTTAACANAAIADGTTCALSCLAPYANAAAGAPGSITCTAGKWVLAAGTTTINACILGANDCPLSTMATDLTPYSFSGLALSVPAGGANTLIGVSGVPSGSAVTVSCATGYVMYGVPTYRRCNTGAWTAAPMPNCTVPANCTFSGLATDVSPFSISGTGCASTGGIASGTSCTIGCAAGFTGAGTSSRVCTNGVWSGANPTCTAPAGSCLTASLTSVTVTGTGCTSPVNTSTVCLASCASGSVATTNVTSTNITCSNGSWTGTQPSCVALPAGACLASALAPATTTCGAYANNSASCLFSCAAGSSGAAVNRTCTNGTWTGTGPNCTASATCNTTTMASDMSKYTVTGCANPVALGATCNVACGGASSVLTCGANGVWNGTLPACTTCSGSSITSDKTFDTSACASIAAGQTCTVSCAAGYTPATSTYTCNNGNWSGSLPTCVPAAGSCNTTTIGSQYDASVCGKLVPDTKTCVVSCAAGSTGTPTTVTCTSGKFTGALPTCSSPAGSCNVSALAVDTTTSTLGAPCASSATVATGSTCTVTCNNDATKTVTRTCTNGNWDSQSNPTCGGTAGACTQASLALDATMTASCASTAVGSTCTVSCAAGYSGISTLRSCNSTDKWAASPANPTCYKSAACSAASGCANPTPSCINGSCVVCTSHSQCSLYCTLTGCVDKCSASNPCVDAQKPSCNPVGFCVAASQNSPAVQGGTAIICKAIPTSIFQLAQGPNKNQFVTISSCTIVSRRSFTAQQNATTPGQVTVLCPPSIACGVCLQNMLCRTGNFSTGLPSDTATTNALYNSFQCATTGFTKLPLATYLATCPTSSSGSKKGLLGLLGLLGLIPLLLCLCLICLMCLRRKKKDPYVSFNVYDTGAANAVVPPVPPMCTAAPPMCGTGIAPICSGTPMPATANACPVF